MNATTSKPEAPTTTVPASSPLLPRGPVRIPKASDDAAPGEPIAPTSIDYSNAKARATSVPPSPQPSTGRHESHDRPGGWGNLRLWAELFNDAQKARISAHNRTRRHAGFDEYLAVLEAAEHACRLELNRAYRKAAAGPIRDWQKAQPGIGEPLLARLLGHLGDPLIATPHAWMENPPDGHVCDPERCGETRHLVPGQPYQRTLRQLWAYCGMGDPERKRRRGMNADDATMAGNPSCKMLVHLLAEACMKQKGKGGYRDVYDAARLKYADRSDWTELHKHNAALRLVSKEILRGLWLAAGGGQIEQAPMIHATTIRSAALAHNSEEAA